MRELSSLSVLASKTDEELQASQYDNYKSKIRHYGEKKPSRKTHIQTEKHISHNGEAWERAHET